MLSVLQQLGLRFSFLFNFACLQFLADFARCTGVDADQAFLRTLRSLAEPIGRICGCTKGAKKILQDHTVSADDAETAVCKLYYLDVLYLPSVL